MIHPGKIRSEVIQTCICPECHAPLSIAGEDYRCQRCNQFFNTVNGIPNFLSQAQITPKISHLSQLYDRASSKHKLSPKSCGYSGRHAFTTRMMILKNWFNFDKLKAKKILDVGCGAGLLTEKLVAQNEIWGVDISPSLLSMASKKGLRVNLSSAEALPFKNQDFDIVFCVGVLPYYLEPGKIISEICRAVKPGGKVLVTSTAESYALRFVRYTKKILGLKSQLEHLYSCGEIEELLRSEQIYIEDSCMGYGDKIWILSNGPIPFKQKLFGRAAAVLGSTPPNP